MGGCDRNLNSGSVANFGRNHSNESNARAFHVKVNDSTSNANSNRSTQLCLKNVDNRPASGQNTEKEEVELVAQCESYT